jgi:hypothetical protein
LAVTAKLRIGGGDSLKSYFSLEGERGEENYTFWKPRNSLKLFTLYRGADKFLARPGRKQATATEDFDFHISYILFINIIGGILVLFIYVT